MNRPSPDDMKTMQVMEYVEELEKENKKIKEKLDKIEKARIKYEDVFYKVTRQWDNNYWELDQVIMNR